jgi:hypothetical protein
LRLICNAFFIATLLLLIACDPGVSIHQITSQNPAIVGSTATDSRVVVNVTTTHQLIGETWYAPKVKVTNESNSPVTVTQIDLFVRSKSYANKTGKAGAYPLTINSGSTESLDVLFRLDEDVQRAFQEPTELLVYYRIGEKQQIARATVIKGRLQDTP